MLTPYRHDIEEEVTEFEKSYLDYFETRFVPKAQQIEILEHAFKYHLSDTIGAYTAPVATGKSAAIMAIARHHAERGKKVVIAPAFNMLCDQYMRDYPNIHVLKGQNHYECTPLAETLGMPASCGHALKLNKIGQFNTCNKCNCCPYSKALQTAKNEKIVILNNHALLHNHHLFDEIDLFIIDEFQQFPKAVASHMSTKILYSDVVYPDNLVRDIPKFTEFMGKFCTKMERMANLLGKKDQKKSLEYFDKAEEARRVAGYLATPRDFHIQEEVDAELGRYIDIRPFKVPEKALEKIFKKTKRTLVFSATIFDSDLAEVGFNLNKVVRHTVKSPIDVNRRRIYATSTYNNVYNNRQRPLFFEKMANTIKRIAKHHKGQKGVVLCTYGEAEKLRGFFKNDGRFLFHTKETKEATFNSFIVDKISDKVLFLSGSWEGIDLKGNIARFNIITIVPYPFLGDPVVKKRKRVDAEWFVNEPLKQVVQGAGRTTRNEKDYSATYILDAKFQKLLELANPNNLDNNFMESLQFGSVTEALRQEEELRRVFL